MWGAIEHRARYSNFAFNLTFVNRRNRPIDTHQSLQETGAIYLYLDMGVSLQRIRHTSAN